MLLGITIIANAVGNRYKYFAGAICEKIVHLISHPRSLIVGDNFSLKS